MYSGFDGITLINCVFGGNTAGGLVSYPGAPPRAGVGGAFYGNDATLNVINCTFTGNHAGLTGGLRGNVGIKITNSILWGNTDEHPFSSVFEAQFAYVPSA